MRPCTAESLTQDPSNPPTCAIPRLAGIATQRQRSLAKTHTRGSKQKISLSHYCCVVPLSCRSDTSIGWRCQKAPRVYTRLWCTCGYVLFAVAWEMMRRYPSRWCDLNRPVDFSLSLLHQAIWLFLSSPPFSDTNRLPKPTRWSWRRNVLFAYWICLPAPSQHLSSLPSPFSRWSPIVTGIGTTIAM